MNRSIISKIVEMTLILFLFFHTFWHLIYFERSSVSVFVSFALLGFVFIYSVIRHWQGLTYYGVRLDNLGASVQASVLPLFLLVAICVGIVMVKGRQGQWPEAREFFTLSLWGIFQQGVIQSYFLLRYFEIVQRKKLAIFLAALTFTAFHVPNVDLMTVTFLGGLYVSHFFLKWRNLFAVGFLHGMISLTLLMTLRPAHVISDNYRVGPDPLGPIRTMIENHRTPEHEIGVFLPSGIPSTFSHYFDDDIKALGSFEELKDFLGQSQSVFVVLSRADYERLIARWTDTQVFFWKYSLAWRRSLRKPKSAFVMSLIKLDINRLSSDLRLPVVLISNQPPPKPLNG
ncbi:MAG: hypothetical protein A3J52_03395 [Omnitrophica bacterium RIFCSPHIGHO2_02_FULL_49_9]|nr:MAG: hypothetical protein A3J52_03395 [Omnitrophica bacterium RIFCSPHIGHO2_02_FULL_49_9]